MQTWLRKKAVAALVFSFSILILGHLAMTRQFPILLQFMMWGPISVVMAGVRAIVEEDLLKKYESVHEQTTPNSSQQEIKYSIATYDYNG